VWLNQHFTDGWTVQGAQPNPKNDRQPKNSGIVSTQTKRERVSAGQRVWNGLMRDATRTKNVETWFGAYTDLCRGHIPSDRDATKNNCASYVARAKN